MCSFKNYGILLTILNRQTSHIQSNLILRPQSFRGPVRLNMLNVLRTSYDFWIQIRKGKKGREGNGRKGDEGEG